MACLRLTLIEPKPGNREEMQTVLTLLDAKLAKTPGLIFSFVTRLETDRLGRVALCSPRTTPTASRCGMTCWRCGRA
jgi:hypothetical protein